MSDRNPSGYAKELTVLHPGLREISQFYLPRSKVRESEISRLQKARNDPSRKIRISLTAEEIVEDAGLEDDGEHGSRAAPIGGSRECRMVA